MHSDVQYETLKKDGDGPVSTSAFVLTIVLVPVVGGAGVPVAPPPGPPPVLLLFDPLFAFDGDLLSAAPAATAAVESVGLLPPSGPGVGLFCGPLLLPLLFTATVIAPPAGEDCRCCLSCGVPLSFAPFSLFDSDSFESSFVFASPPPVTGVRSSFTEIPSFDVSSAVRETGRDSFALPPFVSCASPPGVPTRAAGLSRAPGGEDDPERFITPAPAPSATISLPAAVDLMTRTRGKMRRNVRRLLRMLEMVQMVITAGSARRYGCGAAALLGALLFALLLVATTDGDDGEALVAGWGEGCVDDLLDVSASGAPCGDDR
uniref:Uncharacterized protein n=1 Tax=Anopheles farauti TaxID=69004 RepID=A0A182Q320_9DIPT